MMKKIIFFSLFAFFFTTLAFCEDLKLSFFIGDVFVKQKGKIEWVKASLNMIIKENDVIRTGDNASAEITRKEDVIKIAANTTFTVKVLTEKKDVFSVFFGKVWVRIKRLMEKETSIETPTTVMGLRGTIFSTEVFGKKTIIDLLEGELDVKAEGKRFIIKSGERFLHDITRPIEKRIERRPLTPEEMNKFKDTFNLKELPQTSIPQVVLPQAKVPDVIKEPKKGLFEEFVAPDDRSDLKSEIGNIRNELSSERLSVLTVKQNDFLAGRTIRDMYGNMVRVEQHLYRPTNASIRFVNINKRDTTNGDTSQFSYGMITAGFNKELPDDISKWPEWIAAEVDKDTISELHPETVETILSNGKPNDANADRMKWYSEWDYVKDELTKPKFYIDIGGDNSLNYTEYSNDWTSVSSIPETEFLENKETFNIKDTTGVVKGQLTLGSYLIDNDGNKMKEADFKGMNPFDALNNTACEMRFESTNLLNSPIDIIFTADIIVAGIRSLIAGVIGAIE